jgi:UDP-galactopyranose mutase
MNEARSMPTPLYQEAATPSLFRSFWQAGFESATHVNRHGVRVDMVGRTQHDRFVGEDFNRIRDLGIRVAREGIRWHLVDRAGHFDFSSIRSVVQAAATYDIQVVWNLCHYGSPDGVDLFSPRFVDRFARYAGAVASFIRDSTDAVPFYSPINELSFLSWAAGKVGYIYPYGRERGTELKRNLVRAVIAGSEAIWAVDRRARMLHCDPMIEVIAPADRPDLARAAADATESQFEAWDMIAGGFHPDLQGHPRYLDIIGANYYFSNQWQFPEAALPWDQGSEDARRVPMSRLLERLYRRYHRPLLISETSHVGAGRGRWISEVAEEVRLARSRGIPVEGICLYPIIDRPDWDDPGHWHNSGLWDLELRDGVLERKLSRDYADRLHSVRQALADAGCR